MLVIPGGSELYNYIASIIRSTSVFCQMEGGGVTGQETALAGDFSS